MFQLSGPWLAGALALAYLVGAFTIRYIKDVLKGVPSPLRTALNANETNALAKLKAAEQKAINEAVGLLPAASAPAAAAAPTAVVSVQVVADKAAADIKTAGEKALADIKAAIAASPVKV